ncbi:conserved hypothetical protein (plasmid) [Cupriavidus taiwanensis]|uniref:Uncharacterized protein n=1 Tax=Cupriavidus taiwanensis TaxID=164546 RepID=A0A375FGS5_9BURK|nr:hypothetical protein [Cupriavidus taiwanensis]SOZ71070.1 conserved hypothetical protein [Cupriavidus taiwanensis]SOZ72195.1 conserved hypothetical protein [Cupriavidus taiwanensis]SOZ74496.1 conserved hypothetical protein [Cupriavidus taiwanensis]SPA03425.1 conserved hypothetical protein [Cupriavidus taiwanensis]SPA11346.1 conserved hypothetical protein [Cupriavidus taiwanensis]
MNLITDIELAEFFGSTATPPAIQLINTIPEGGNDNAEVILWTTVLSFPTCLPPYYMLYKLQASRGELRKAQEVADKALVAAARQASINIDWRAVWPGDADFTISGPARFWLFTLKAQALFSIRLGEHAMALQLMNKLRWLDPNNSIGLDIVDSLLARSPLR